MSRNNDNGDDGNNEWQEGLELTNREEEEALAIRADARQLLFDLGIGDYRMVEGDYNDWYASEERQLLWDVVDGNYDTSNLNREDGETASTEPLTLSSSSHNSSSSVFDFIEYYNKFIDSTLPSPLPTPPLPPPIPLITLPWDDPLPPMPPLAPPQQQQQPQQQLLPSLPPPIPLLTLPCSTPPRQQQQQQQQQSGRRRRRRRRRIHPAYRQISDEYPPDFPLWFAGGPVTSSRN